MGRAARKKWLLELWEYHNGSLREEEVKEIESKISTDSKAKTDSVRVLGIISELRQSGRWETHPEFPSQMVDRLLGTEGGGGARRWALVGGIAVLILLYFLFGRGDSEASGLTGAIWHVRSAVLSFFEKSPSFSETRRFDRRSLRLEYKMEEVDNLHEDFLFSATLEFDLQQAPRPRMLLEDPVSRVEAELDKMFEGGFTPGGE